MSDYSQMYMEMAEVAAKSSLANRLKVGSIIVKENTVISMGFNGTPKGWPTNVCEGPDGLTLPEVLHSEMNSLAAALRSGNSTKGATIYITHSPCDNCAKHLVAAGIEMVYYRYQYRCSKGIELLTKAGIPCKRI
ncbi:MAG: putative ComE operon protein 2 [Prokaryotic dsDNA virus sp.]|nr:MAG: putative ComE operon protein 2 [Prokaryotic dsDNA virus sp.]|tara:strand:+ start:34531 stop:34935 length:405 start_codon:yes stop_codon:yes gene_type:complete